MKMPTESLASAERHISSIGRYQATYPDKQMAEVLAPVNNIREIPKHKPHRGVE